MNPPVDEIGVFLCGRVGSCLDECVEFSRRHGAKVRLLPPLLGHGQEDVVSHFGHPLSPLQTCAAPTAIREGGHFKIKKEPAEYAVCFGPKNCNSLLQYLLYQFLLVDFLLATADS